MSAEEIKRTLQTLYSEEDVIEIRIIKDDGRNQAGYYDYSHFQKLAEDAHKFDGLPGIPGIYITVNPVHSILLARGQNKIKPAKITTTDSQTRYRKYLPFDIDPERPAGVSSTDEMHEKSIEKAKEVKEWLNEKGFPDPIVADSGNGAHLLYRIDEPNTPEAKELIGAVQKAVTEALNHPEKEGIDIQGFANASRIWKLYGTVARKGEEIPEQGIRHRRSKMLEVPDDIKIVTTEQLRAVAALYQPDDKVQPQHSKQPYNGDKFDVVSWMEKNNIPVVRTKKESDRTVYVLKKCPINPEHTGSKESSVIQYDDGKLGFKCHHNSCSDKHWYDVRELYEPGYKNKNKTDTPAQNKKASYFIEKKFIPKYLGDEILDEENISTYKDTRETLLYENGIFRKGTGEDSVRLKLAKKLDLEFNRNRINEVIEYIKLNTFEDREQFDNEPFLLNLKNGMYDVVNDKLLPHDPEYKSTIQLNINYDPAAECPTINKFINEIVGCGDVLPLIQYAGYCFTTDIKQQKAALLVGDTKNGKSTFLDMLSHAIGQENVAEQSIQALNTEKFSRAQLNGKVVNIFPDLPKTKLYDNSVFKMLVGDEYLDGEEKYIKGYRFRNITKQLYSANQVPPLHDPDESAFFIRWLIFLFPNSFSGNKADKNLIKKITTDEELSGFFNLAMVGLRALLKYGNFAYLRDDEEIKKLYLIKSNPVSSFLDECVCYSETDYPKRALYDEYVEWCESNDVTKIVKNNVFAKQLLKLGYEDYRESMGDRVTVWKNITPVRVGVRDKKSTLTDSKEPIDIYFNLIRQGSKVTSDIVVEYEKIYTYYYTILNPDNTFSRGTLTAGKNDKTSPPDNEKNPSRLNLNPDGSLTDFKQSQNIDNKYVCCDRCGVLKTTTQIEAGPAGLKNICHTCQDILKSEHEERTKTPPPKNNGDLLVIRANKDLPTFAGVNGINYTLAAGDVATIPLVNAEALIKRNVAVQVVQS